MDKNPGGNAKLIFDKLESKYQGKATPNLIKLENKFANMKLNSVDEDDPDTFITNLEAFCVRMN